MSLKPLKKESQFDRWRKERGLIKPVEPIIEDERRLEWRQAPPREEFQDTFLKRVGRAVLPRRAELKLGLAEPTRGEQMRERIIRAGDAHLDILREEKRRKRKETVTEYIEAFRDINRKDVTRAAKMTGVKFLDLTTESIDFIGGLLARHAPDILTPLMLSREKKQEWVDFVNRNWEKMPSHKLKRAVDRLEEAEFMQPSPEWQEATLGEKFGPEHIAETTLHAGTDAVASIGTVALAGPKVGIVALATPVASSVREGAMEHGWTSDQADLLAIPTAVTVGFLERIVPARIFGGSLEIKNKFIGSFAKRLMETTFLEMGTEITQESVQMLAESTFREIGFDEAMTRYVMSAYGGGLMGGGMQSLATFADNVRRDGFKMGLMIEEVGKAPDKKPDKKPETPFEKWQKERGIKPEVEPRVEVEPEVKPEVEVPAISKELEPLVRKARKFETAEEFVEAYLKLVSVDYGKKHIKKLDKHYGDKFEFVEPVGDLWNTNNKILFARYKNRFAPVDYEEPASIIQDIQEAGGKDVLMVKMKESLPKSKTKTKSQLIDIWKDAQAIKEEKIEVKPEIEPPIEPRVEVPAIPKELEPLTKERIAYGYKQYAEAEKQAVNIINKYGDKNIDVYGSFATLKRRAGKKIPDLDIIIEDKSISDNILNLPANKERIKKSIAYAKRFNELVRKDEPHRIIKNVYNQVGRLDIPEKYQDLSHKVIDAKIRITFPDGHTVWYGIKPDGTLRRIEEALQKEHLKVGRKPIKQALQNFHAQAIKEVKPEVEAKVKLPIKPIKKEIRKKPPTLRELGVKPPISPFVKKREYTLLKDRIKNVARGAKEGRTATRQEIRAVQTELLDILDASRMEAVDKAKFRRTIKNVQTQEQLQKILPVFEKKVVDLIEKREVRTLKNKIKKELRKFIPKKYKPGRTTVIYELLRKGLKQKYFDKVGVRTQAQNETLLEELQSKIENYDIADPIHREDFVLHALLSEDTKGLDEMNVGELDAVLTRIQQTRKIARDSFLWKQLERAADLREKIEGSIENMRGKGVRLQTPTNKRRLRRGLRRFISTIDIFDRGFLQIVNLLDSIRGGRFFRDAIYQPIMQGNKDYFVQDNNFVEADKKFFEKVFNKKGILLDRQIAKLSKQQNIGEVIDEKGTKHNLWFTNSEMIDIYLYGKTKPTTEAMKEQGIYVGGDNPKTRVFYMTDSVLAKIEGKMSREAKMIAGYIMENIQDNEFVKKMTDSYEFKYNKPFPFIGETYWTMVRRYMGTKQKGSDIFNPEHNRDAILSPNSFKQRIENNNPLVVSDGWGKFIKWRRDIQKFISYDEALVNAKAVIGSPDFKSEFIEKYGYKSYKHLIDSFNVVAVGGRQHDDMLAHSVNYIRQILSISFVGGRPVRSLAGQSTSFVAAIAEVPLKDFSKSLGKFVANPKITYNKMMRSPIVALRHKRADFTKGMLEAETRKFQRYGISPAEVAMFFVKVGDMVGVLGAGYAIYDYNYNQYIEGGMDKKKADKMAMQDMEYFVVTTQQSALSELRNWIMQQHPIIRITGTFQQAQSQYRAKGFEAMNTWLHSENKWSKKNFGRMFKKVSAFHFILPVLFKTSRGNIDPANLISNTVFSPISGFMGYGQVVEWAIKLAIYSTLIPFLGLDEDEWKRLLPFDPTTLTGESKIIFERTLKSAKDIIKQDGDERDVRRLIESSLMLLKIPARNIREEYIKFHEILTGEDDSFLRILETEWQAKQRIKRKEKKKEEEKEKRMERLRPPRPERPTRPTRPTR